jgi:hypothetical protein
MKSKKLIPWNKGGSILTDEQRKRISDAAKNRKPLSPESRAKGNEKRKGQKRSEETKLKMSLVAKGKLKGPMSEEQKLARSITMKGKPKKEGHGSNVANALKGNISINKDGIEKRVKQDTLQQYLSEGWNLGGRKRNI